MQMQRGTGLVQNFEGGENFYKIVRLEKASIDPKRYRYNCTTDMHEPHEERRGKLLKQISDTRQAFVLDLRI